MVLLRLVVAFLVWVICTDCVLYIDTFSACLLPDAIDRTALSQNRVSKTGFGGSDIDLFICGLTEEQADRKVSQINVTTN